MGATDFMTKAKGKTAKEAFSSAVAEAQHERGHGGYTGTIAEKNSFTMIRCPVGIDPRQFACDLICKEDTRIDDKRGPAGCIDLGSGEWLFFGWAAT